MSILLEPGLDIFGFYLDSVAGDECDSCDGCKCGEATMFAGEDINVGPQPN